MGQKVNPVSFRTGEFVDWKARWFAENRDFKEKLLADIRLRRALMVRLKTAGITDVIIERLPKAIMVRLLVTRPGMVIGRGGSGVEEIRLFINKTLGKLQGTKIEVSIEEVKDPELSARLVANRIVQELERRLPARRVVNKSIERVMTAGAAGVKVVLSGRIGGAEIGRREKYQNGSVPSQTMRANIDYAQEHASLKKGYVGVKVWIHRKEE
ncbi:30S ribosomal protein S3 [Candidatus Microgenomates bacterium]|nr:30S ribosomal protein S3 [Candidatus Microgenomates bacterium]